MLRAGGIQPIDAIALRPIDMRARWPVISGQRVARLRAAPALLVSRHEPAAEIMSVSIYSQCIFTSDEEPRAKNIISI